MANETQDPTIKTVRETVEVITPDGQTLSGADNLSSIFDKIEAGKGTAEEVIKEVMSSKPEGEVAETVKEPEPTPEPVEAVEPEETTLDQKIDKKEAETTEPAKEPAKEPDVNDEELAVLPHDKPKTAKRIRALLDKIAKADEIVATTRKEALEKAAKLDELQKQLATVKTVDPKTEEEIKQQLDELVQYRRRYALETDPQVSAKFDGRIKGADEVIYNTLTKAGAGDELLNLIKEEGGWTKFSDSGKIIPLKGGDKQTAAELAQTILNQLSYSSRRAIDAAMIDQMHAKQEKERFFNEETSKAKQYFEQQELQRKQQQEAQEKNVKEGREYIANFEKELRSSEFMQEKTVPGNATPEQRAAIEEHNQWAKQTNAELVKYSNSKTLPEIMAVVKDAVLYHNERRQHAIALAKVKQLEAQLLAVKNAGRTTKAGSIAAGSTTPPPRQAPKVLTLDERVEAMERGETVDA